MATRILAAWYLTRQDENYPATNFDAWNPNGPIALHVNAQTNDTDELRSVHSILPPAQSHHIHRPSIPFSL